MKADFSLHKRISFVLLLVIGSISLLAVRIAWIQFVDGKRMDEKMQAQLKDTRVLFTPRGVIYDRNGRELALSALRKSYMPIGEIPEQRREETARLLAPILNRRIPELLELLKSDSRFAWIERTLEPDTAEKITALIESKRLIGLHFLEESKRIYPNGVLAAHVLGFVGTDDIGLEGIEMSYDRLIRGELAKRFIETDSMGVPIFQFNRPVAPAKPMTNLYLTIDSSIQFIAEQSLDKLMAEKRAKAATVIIMNPRTGEVLAMASRPGYDPNDFGRYPAEAWKNRAVSIIYEPGSTFKAVVAAAAMQEGLVAPGELFNELGTDIGRRHYGEELGWRGRGVIPFTDVIKDSINTGFVTVGQRLGAARLMQYTRQFGFGRNTDLRLPGEEDGLLFEAQNMRTADLASVSIGQSIAVTPIQLLTAIAAIANDGVLLRPYIVKELRNSNSSSMSISTTETTRQVVSKDTAKTLTGMLEKVVSDGGGKLATVKGYRFAGKTGTAEKLKESGSGYESGHYIASFAGFGPDQEPQYAALIVIDDPVGAYYGGQIAAPVFSEIMAKVMLYRSMQQNIDKIANVQSGRVERNIPLDAEIAAVKQGKAAVLYVRGKTVREAAHIITDAGFTFIPVGSGLATSQQPAPLAIVNAGSEVKVTFSQ